MFNLKAFFRLSTFAFAVLSLGVADARAYEDCELVPAVEDRGANIFDGQTGSTGTREDVASYVAKIKRQSQLVRELLRFGLSQGLPANRETVVSGWEQMVEGIDSYGRDLNIYRHPDKRNAERELYEINWYSGDTSVGVMVEVLGRMADETRQPYVIKLVGSQGDGSWYDCDFSIKKKRER